MKIPARRDDGKGLSEIQFDDQDADLVGKWKWRVTGNGYAYRNAWVDGRSVKTYLHRVILNPTGSVEVDHINGDRLDNRRSNLRPCTRADNNAAARRTRKGRSSKFRGVTWAKDKQRWQAQIGYRGKNIILGRFAAEEDAARRYDEEARKLYGDFARPNFT